MAKKPDPIDHGTFTLSSPQESVMLVQLLEQARKNTKKPGHAWGRIEGSRTVDCRIPLVLTSSIPVKSLSSPEA